MDAQAIADKLNAIPHRYVTKIQYARKFHAVVEYARPNPMPDLTAYYRECRMKARSPNCTFVGD
jgi:hypothetical protein